jgi:hypothetical protein
MITVSIGGMTVPIEQTSEGWINQMIADARRHQIPLCIRVNIEVPTAHVALSSGACPGSAGGGRMPNAVERQILNSWTKRGLANNVVHPGELRSFLNELSRLI